MGKDGEQPGTSSAARAGAAGAERASGVQTPADVVVVEVTGRRSFEELYSARYTDLVRLAALLTSRPAVAHDVVQDAFIRLYAAWDRVRDPEHYVKRSVVNGSRSYLRWVRLRRGRPDRRPMTDTLGVDHTLSALAGLPYRQRAALVLKFYEALTHPEIADVLGCREGTVHSLVHRGLQQLRKDLTDGERT